MARPASGARTATSVDLSLGARIRALRSERKMSQEQLAAAIGVTFQQVQKYEKGVNRVAASTLVDICDALNIAPASLLPPIGGSETTALESDDLAELTKIYVSLNSEGRATLLKVARALRNEVKRGAARRASS